jgi:effector-binding domain-containing protein
MTDQTNGNAVELLQLPSQPTVSVRVIIPIAQLGDEWNDRILVLWEHLRNNGVEPIGSPFVRYHTFAEGQTDLETGVPVAEPVAGEGRVASSELPAGPAIATWHIGSHEGLGNAYARLGAWMQEHGGEPNGPGWEEYHWIDHNQNADPAAWQHTASWRTRLVQPIKALPSS